MGFPDSTFDDTWQEKIREKHRKSKKILENHRKTSAFQPLYHPFSYPQRPHLLPLITSASGVLVASMEESWENQPFIYI